jgi:hypothetical protein
MENKEFTELLILAKAHLDELDKMVKDTFEEEDRMMQNLLKPVPDPRPTID